MTDEPCGFEAEMAGPDHVLVDLLSIEVSTQPMIRIGRYYRFGRGQPVLRLDAVSPTLWRRAYTFTDAAGNRIERLADDVIESLRAGRIDEIVPVRRTVAEMYASRVGMLKIAAASLATTIETDAGLKRTSRRRMAKSQAQGRDLVRMLDDLPPQDWDGVARIQATVAAFEAYEAEIVADLQAKANPSEGEIRRHQAILGHLIRFRTAVTDWPIGTENALERLKAALLKAERQAERRSGAAG